MERETFSADLILGEDLDDSCFFSGKIRVVLPVPDQQGIPEHPFPGTNTDPGKWEFVKEVGIDMTPQAFEFTSEDAIKMELSGLLFRGLGEDILRYCRSINWRK